jgi:hypothetical protein
MKSKTRFFKTVVFKKKPQNPQEWILAKLKGYWRNYRLM